MPFWPEWPTWRPSLVLLFILEIGHPNYEENNALEHFTIHEMRWPWKARIVFYQIFVLCRIFCPGDATPWQMQITNYENENKCEVYSRIWGKKVTGDNRTTVNNLLESQIHSSGTFIRSTLCNQNCTNYFITAWSKT